MGKKALIVIAVVIAAVVMISAMTYLVLSNTGSGKGIFGHDQDDKPPIANEPRDSAKFLAKADSVAKAFDKEMVLVGIEGGEYHQELVVDMHPAKDPYKKYCDADPQKNDGKCYLWTYTYFSSAPISGQTWGRYLYFVTLDGRGDVFFEGQSHIYRWDFYSDKALLGPCNSTTAARVANLHGGSDLLSRHASLSVFYWLYKDQTGTAIWTVYYSNGTSILLAVDVDAVGGTFLGLNMSLRSCSFLTAESKAQGMAILWKGDALLSQASAHENEGHNIDSFSLPGKDEDGVLIPPDTLAADGMAPVWKFTYVTDTAKESLILYVWANGQTYNYTYLYEEDDSSSDYWPQVNRSVIDSTSAVDAAKDAGRMWNERMFLNYNLYFSKDHITGNFTAEWGIWWMDSPDCSDGVYMDANTGVVEPRY